MSGRPRSAALALGLAALCVAVLAPAASAGGYPRLGLYGGINGNGFPYILGGNRLGPLDPAMCDSVARYDEVILDASPISEYRRDVALALRQRHPGVSLLGYVNAEYIWPAEDQDSLVHYPTRFHHLIRNLGGYLYDQSGTEYVQANVNIAKRDAQGRYVVAESLAALFDDAIAKTGVWDGIFLDGYCEDIRWTENATAHIDYVRAGYGSLDAFAIGWRAGVDTLATRLRARSGSTYVLVGNCGQGTMYTPMNGWMRENFPYQNGGDWEQNMFRDPGGYFVDEQRFRAPRHDYLFSAADPPLFPYNANNARKVRYGLASAALAGGFGVFGYGAREVGTYNYSTWWYDEYAVNLATGQSSGNLADTGWLGLPLGGASQMIWLGPGPDAPQNPGFENDVTTDWQFTPNIPGTIAWDTTTAALGRASARINVPSPGVADWQVNLVCLGRIPVTAGNACAATFWAKGSAARPLGVSAFISGPNSVAYQTVDLTTTWKHYQVVLSPSQSGNAGVSFSFAAAAGDVWVDDVHFEVGATNLWRRDFQNGIVLVNPSLLPLTVPLEKTFHHLAGIVAPTVNDGSSVNAVTLGAEDALFLISNDNVPPRPVTDLTPVPH
ncbi:MAG: carbohydrate binding domain-containing protein [Candidatus Eisenbacteria bacterium]|uniref:Carbohydrate binding domain-containing protein n=1 Tax=Eiseniibacteriota bacterium TaxID=2212470 RepID=A0A9D6LAQ3_UNCEI|nr:carbohydrate binding domain-containing protein [Candidatus Eisenbacteria bacterium]MBI3539174.1 carbohydrate binding domain-containing protein [Candidatus Eisenbacteria bacterium]